MYNCLLSVFVERWCGVLMGWCGWLQAALCNREDVVEGRGMLELSLTVRRLFAVAEAPPPPPTTLSTTLCAALLIISIILVYLFPPPDWVFKLNMRINMYCNYKEHKVLSLNMTAKGIDGIYNHSNWFCLLVVKFNVDVTYEKWFRSIRFSI